MGPPPSYLTTTRPGITLSPEPGAVQAHWEARGRWIKEAAIMRARAITFMAGAETEVELFGKCQGGDGDDRLQVALMVEAFADGNDALRWEARLRRHARGLVQRHLGWIVRVAVDLLSRGTLTVIEVDQPGAAPRLELPGSLVPPGTVVRQVAQQPVQALFRPVAGGEPGEAVAAAAAAHRAVEPDHDPGVVAELRRSLHRESAW